MHALHVAGRHVRQALQWLCHVLTRMAILGRYVVRLNSLTTCTEEGITELL